MKKLLFILLCLPVFGFGQNQAMITNNNLLYFPEYVKDSIGEFRKIDGKVLFHGKTLDSFYLPNGDKFQGDWKDGMRNGAGIYTFLNGEVLNGKWKDNGFQYFLFNEYINLEDTIRNYVNSKMEIWLIKDEFEKLAHYQARTSGKELDNQRNVFYKEIEIIIINNH